MELLDKLFEENRLKPEISGHWSLIQWRPDLATSESLNIGIAFVGTDGARSIKMLDTYEKVKCLYSESMVFHAQLACDVAREYFLNSPKLEAEIGKSIKFFSKGYCQGSSTENLVEHLFCEMVPLARKSKRPASDRFKSVDRDSLLISVKDQLRLKLELRYEEFCPQNPYHQISIGNHHKSVFLPFENRSGYGTIASAVYADPNRVVSNLYTAQQDIELAGSNLEKNSNAIFLLNSSGYVDDQRRHTTDELIDVFIHHMNSKKIYVGCHSSKDELSEDIADWARKAA
jgi:hypothetical protein